MTRPTFLTITSAAGGLLAAGSTASPGAAAPNVRTAATDPAQGD